MEVATFVGGLIGVLLAILFFAIPVLLLVWLIIFIVRKMKGEPKKTKKKK